MIETVTEQTNLVTKEQLELIEYLFQHTCLNQKGVELMLTEVLFFLRFTKQIDKSSGHYLLAGRNYEHAKRVKR